jgi:hypothetical protein
MISAYPHSNVHRTTVTSNSTTSPDAANTTERPPGE